MFEDLPRDEVLTKIDSFISELLQEANIQQPPVDAIRLAQGHLGMVVCLDRRQSARGRAQRNGGRPGLSSSRSRARSGTSGPSPTKLANTSSRNCSSAWALTLIKRGPWPANR